MSPRLLREITSARNVIPARDYQNQTESQVTTASLDFWQPPASPNHSEQARYLDLNLLWKEIGPQAEKCGKPHHGRASQTASKNTIVLHTLNRQGSGTILVADALCPTIVSDNLEELFHTIKQGQKIEKRIFLNVIVLVLLDFSVVQQVARTAFGSVRTCCGQDYQALEVTSHSSTPREEDEVLGLTEFPEVVGSCGQEDQCAVARYVSLKLRYSIGTTAPAFGRLVQTKIKMRDWRWLLQQFVPSQSKTMVCDVFAGTGTFGIAAIEMGYTTAFIEINKELGKEIKTGIIASTHSQTSCLLYNGSQSSIFACVSGATLRFTPSVVFTDCNSDARSQREKQSKLKDCQERLFGTEAGHQRYHGGSIVSGKRTSRQRSERAMHGITALRNVKGIVVVATLRNSKGIVVVATLRNSKGIVVVATLRNSKGIVVDTCQFWLSPFNGSF
ncbi:hypothetical protein BJ742DRAFT_912012 [Cladochytrium replicatum]|nr:hypothetical protein BJ742DRAFT_912012 [Cladochytrium replicatum]